MPKRPFRNRLNDLDPKTWLKFQKSWFLHNPPPRRKDVLRHPAKFPETLAQEFIEFFTKQGQVVLDPMAGTGSTLVGALRAGRHSYGVELNPAYAGIARQVVQTEREALGNGADSLAAQVITGDAARLSELAEEHGLPPIDYLLTSPPYWDMLHARGAHTQKERRSDEALDMFYSDDPNDLGNLADYDRFLERLAGIYEGLQPLLRPGAYLTIIVKNVKKGGKIYPLAWDLGRELGKTYTIKDEKIWCLPPGQNVWTQSGLKSIEQVTVGEKVLTHTGKLQNVTKTMQRQHSGQLISIKVSLLGKSISLTPEHEVLTIHRKKYLHQNGKPFHENFQRSTNRKCSWKPAKDLEQGDVVAFPIPNAIVDLAELDASYYMPELANWLQDEYWYYTRGRGKYGRGKLPKQLQINNEFMSLTGWYLSEGSGTTSGVYIANQSHEAQKEITHLFRSVFDANSRVHSKGVWCRSRSVSTLLSNLLGKGAHHKRIPDFMLHLPLEKQKHLLKALWTGDGHARQNSVLYKTVSENLALGITYMTARIGAVPYIERNSNWFNLNYRGQSMVKMQNLLGVVSWERISVRDQHWVRDSHIWLPIREIKIQNYTGLVHNLEVENDNSYVTENFAVHNCQDNQRLAPYGLGSAWVSNTFHHYCLQFRNE